MNKRRVVVIGAGVGGLACALRLVNAGLEVTVVEAASTPGGKLRPVEIDHQMLDAGPTVFTMRWVFEELFDDCGLSLDKHLPLEPAKTLARHAWSRPGGGHDRLDLFACEAASADAIGQLAGAREARGYLAFSQRSREIYKALDQHFVRAPRPHPLTLIRRAGIAGLPQLARISPFTTLMSELGKYFQDPRLRQLFGRYATYCGSSPYLAPATLMLIAHVEQDGLWLLKGGMHRLATVLAELIEASGGRIQYGTRALEILQKNGHITGVQVQGQHSDSYELEANAVVFNGDAAALYSGLLGLAHTRKQSRHLQGQRSLSAITWNIVTKTNGFPLLRHNVFFSDDYSAEFKSIFSNRSPPVRPSVYVCAQDRSDHNDQALGQAERLLCLVNAPATGDSMPWSPACIAACEAEAAALLDRCGLQLDAPLNTSLVTTPKDFATLFPGTGGALYGNASHSWLSSFARPGSRTHLNGLYLAGGSVHPGPGVPMAALSGKLAAASVLEDQD